MDSGGDFVQGRTFVSGSSENGKSSWIKAAVKDHKRLLIWDPLDEYHRSIKRVKRFEALPEIGKALLKPNFRLAYVPDLNGDSVAIFAALVSMLFRLQADYQRTEGQIGERLTLVVEEADTAFPATTLKAEHNIIVQLAKLGRHYGIDIIWSTQRPTLVNKTARGNLSKVICFYQSEYDDALLAAKAFQPEFSAKDIISLDQYHYIWRKQRQFGNGVTKRV